MEELMHFEKLKVEQNRVLERNKTETDQREKLIGDYKSLDERLSTLTDETTQKTMIPIGSIGFFPGRLAHTNELLVLLGENWFAERSAKQAREIIQRRIEFVENQISALKKEFNNVKSQQDFTEQFKEVQNEHNEFKEIKEEVPDDYVPRAQQGKRLAHVPKHNLFPRSVDMKKKTPNEDDEKRDVDTIDHEELFARLNQLEMEEDAARSNQSEEELQEETAEHEERLRQMYEEAGFKQSSTESNSTEERRVKFEDDHDSDDSFSTDDDAVDRFFGEFSSAVEPTNGEEMAGDGIIQQRERSMSDSVAMERPIFTSPADIYERYRSSNEAASEEQRPLKSILKKDSRSNSNENLKLRPILKSSPEHRPNTPENTLEDHRKPILKTPPDTQGSDRRPGTPELFLDEPRPILKSAITHPKPNVAPHHVVEVHFAEQSENDEMKSILKRDGMRSATPDEEIYKGILKPDQSKCPENNAPEKHVPNAGSDRKSSILKNPLGVSGTVVERDVLGVQQHGASGFSHPHPQHGASTAPQQQTASTRPVSKFKSSRMKR